MTPIKSTDVPPELRQALEEQFPGLEIRCLGDGEKLPPEIEDQLNRIMRHAAETFVAGKCVDCGKQIPGEWPPANNTLPEGWQILTDLASGEPSAIQCPECDQKELARGTTFVDCSPSDGFGGGEVRPES